MKKSSKENNLINTTQIFFGIWKNLRKKRRLQIYLLLIVVLASATSEVFSLGSVIPFLSVLVDPNTIWDVEIVRNLSLSFGYQSPNDLLLPTTVLFCICILIASLIRLLNLWLNGRLSAAIGSDLSCDVFAKTIYQPYNYYLQTNSSELMTSISTFIPHTVLAINQFFLLISSVFIAFSLLVVLLFINAKIAIISILIFTAVYGLLSLTIKNMLSTNSNFVANSARKELGIIQESIGGIRDIIIDGNYDHYLRLFRKVDIPMRVREVQNIFLGAFPRYSLEGLAMILVAILGFYLNSSSSNGISTIPLLGTVALGAQRLLPAVQQIFSAWASINGKKSSILNVLEILDKPLNISLYKDKKALDFKKYIQLSKIKFKYSNQNANILENFNLKINKGERLGIIGSTGSGKSTLMDLIIGLLIAKDGSFLIDGSNLYNDKNQKKIKSWMLNIAHVPQNIFLSDNSILENIAFGIPKEKININKVIESTRAAQLENFIEDLPYKFHTFVGERGVRLSGGQRQRIGIARAFYRDPKVLILDEATSALDINTEKLIMDEISLLRKDLTIIIIAHRHSTLLKCDRIIEIKKGEIIKEGNPKDVLL